jgi:amino acid adenylation domain-containing protein
MELSERVANLTPEQRAKLEARLRERRGASKPIQDVIERLPASEPPLLSFAQERLWFLEQLEGASATYNIYSATRLKGELQIHCLEQALTEILARHESLRTTFPSPTSSQPPRQEISEPSEFQLEFVDLSSNAEAKTESGLRNVVNEFVQRPMSVAVGPLFRARLYHLGSGDHAFVVVVHHIVADGWSLDVFFRELSTLYIDFYSGGKPSLPPLKIQYADFTRWQRQRHQAGVFKAASEYWNRELAGNPPVLDLPLDFPRQAQQSYRGAECQRWLGVDLTDKIRLLCKETGATLFMSLLAAFNVVLHRYSGHSIIHVGFPVANRSSVEIEPLIGFFVNMLVFRTDLSGDPTFRDLIRQVRQTTFGALAHQEMPFEQLVRELKPERSLSHAPLFQVTLIFEEKKNDVLQLPGLTSESIPVSTASAKFDMTLHVSEQPEGLLLALEYAADLFTVHSAERILTHVGCLLESAVANPDQQISELNMLALEEEHQLLVGWNQTAADYPRETTLHAIVEEQARRVPNAVAVECGRKRLSYGELNRRAEALAGELRRKGVQTETRVGLFMDRSIDMIVGLLGILKAGGAYVPLDPAFPKDRLAFMVTDAQIPVLVTVQRLVAELPPHQTEVVCVDRVKEASHALPRVSSGSAENLAYVIYTSGSSGRPKGVQISHRAVVNFLESMRHQPGLNAGDVLLAVTTLSFDIAGLELFLPLTTGARVVVAPREIAVDGPRLAAMIDEVGATVMQATPATWRLLLAAGWTGCPRLKILCGGEALPSDLARELLPRCGELWNMYGPTETTIWSTCSRVLAADDIHIGRPIANTQTYVLDARLQPVPIGGIGELFIGGDGLARGYLNQPELTAEKFIPNPFQTQARLYRTGDLARYRADGNIVCLGRIDFQVKLRGYRIELGEIEAVLAAHPGVSESVVSVYETGEGSQQLVAWVVYRSGQTPTFSDLRKHLQQKLPDYMVPTIFVPLDRLPLTPNGKMDRRALPPPNSGHAAKAASYVAPRNETEAKLAKILSRVLGLERVGVTDDFFALGGHSLLAVMFFAEIERQMNRKFPLATLFRAATVEKLAREFEVDREVHSEWSSLVAIQPEGSKPPLYCVHGAGGNILLYRDLTRELGRDYPVYGFQSRGLDGRTKPLNTVEEMAVHYLAELKSFQPEGPYRLAGYCLGGMIAYQMARILQQSGDSVALVALLDSYNPSEIGSASRVKAIWQRTKFHFSNIKKLRLREFGRYFKEKLRVAREGELSNLLGLENKPQGENTPPGDLAITRSSSEINIQRLNDHATALFRPEPYSGSVVLLKPEVNYSFMSDPQMGWGKLVKGDLDTVALPVNPHAMLVEPFVKHLAGALRRRLDQG